MMWSGNMKRWSVFVSLIVTVCATPRDEFEGADQENYESGEVNRKILHAEYKPDSQIYSSENNDAGNKFYFFNVEMMNVEAKRFERSGGSCGGTRCKGPEYQCIDDKCYCAPGYIPNHFQVRCVRCPGLGDKCFGQCCNPLGNETLTCWQSRCRPCYDSYGNWICRGDNVKDILLISSAQVAMGTALVFGIIATFVLLFKLCAATNLRPVGGRVNDGSRLSIGSLQLYIEERLRDAPPRYTRASPPGPTNLPVSTYLNNGFVHDSSIPPPPYTEEVKTEDNRNTAIHI